MNYHAIVDMDAFQAWLEEAARPAVPCDTGKCVLAVWLQDDGYPDARVDGEEIYIGENVGTIETPTWCNAIMSTFDSMAADYAPYKMPQAEIAPEVYKGPLLSAITRMRPPRTASSAAGAARPRGAHAGAST